MLGPLILTLSVNRPFIKPSPIIFLNVPSIFPARALTDTTDLRRETSLMPFLIYKANLHLNDSKIGYEAEAAPFFERAVTKA